MISWRSDTALTSHGSWNITTQESHADLIESDSLRTWKFLQTLDNGIIPLVPVLKHFCNSIMLLNMSTSRDLKSVRHLLTIEQTCWLKLELTTSFSLSMLSNTCPRFERDNVDNSTRPSSESLELEISASIGVAGGENEAAATSHDYCTIDCTCIS